ncbi:unnamed protein product [Rotaria sp. Silwood2]|nr:unnamed protein product [Rotaria sp. Silwood2]
MVVLEPYSVDLLWILIVGFIIAFVLAFGIGANDVANSFGTSVGSRVLTLRQACILATIFEILGSILIGAKVSDTIRKGIIDPTLFENPKELMLGQISSLLGCCIWLLVATFFNLPVSGTHSIVGATVGFALVAHGSRGIRWIEFAKIGGSWFASPALAGIISIAVFMFIRKFILEHPDQLTVGLRWLPFFYGLTIMINFFSILLSAPPLLYFDRIPLWGKFITTILVGLLVGLGVMVIVKPRMRKTIEALLKKKRDLDARGETEEPEVSKTDGRVETGASGSKKKRDIETRREDEPQLTKTDGRFASYSVTLENVNTSDKETQIDHISMLKEFDLIRYQQLHPDQFRPYVEMQRIRKDSETISSPGVSGVLRVRRESDRFRTEILGSDDLRGFEFDNLEATKRNQVNDEQLKCIDNLITTMDLTHADRCGDEAFRPELVFNPYIQRMFQSIARRAVTPDEPLSLSNTIMEMNDTLLRSITGKSKRILNTIHEKFALRDTDRRQKITTGDALFGNVDSAAKRARLDENENIEEPTATTADSASFESQAAAKKKAAIRNVGTLTPVEDFKLLIEQGSPSFAEVCKQMCNIILELVHNSHGDALFEKAFQCLQCLREICINKLEPKIFNDLESLLKKQASTIDGRKDFWQKIIDGMF